jgi:AraC-like DNA-binding protein
VTALCRRIVCVTAGVGESAETGCSAVQFRTADLDEARELCERYYYPITIEPVHAVDRLEMSFQAASIGPVTVGVLGFSQDLRISSRDLVTGYQITMPVTGRMVSVHRNIAVTAGPGEAIVFQPVGGARVDPLPADCRLLAIKIEQSALENQLEEALGRPIAGPVALAPSMDVSHGPGLSWAKLAGLLVSDMLDPAGLTSSPLVAERLAESLIRGLLVAVDHPYREALTRPDTSYHPRPLRLALDAMRADPAHPYSVDDLARLAGVSVRALQAIFHRHTGLTPIAYLRELRLARVHDELRRAVPGETTVAQVAHRWGFGHLGRFAAAYRDKYGVAPSETLRRR